MKMITKKEKEYFNKEKKMKILSGKKKFQNKDKMKILTEKKEKILKINKVKNASHY